MSTPVQQSAMLDKSAQMTKFVFGRDPLNIEPDYTAAL